MYLHPCAGYDIRFLRMGGSMRYMTSVHKLSNLVHTISFDALSLEYLSLRHVVSLSVDQSFLM